jgi:arsenate reductase
LVSRVLTVYLYQNCSTCRNAKKWLQERGIAFEEKAIRETPPSVEELRQAEAVLGLSKLFNSSGNDYRAMGMKDRLSGMSKDEAFALLSAKGNLVKRPLVIGDGVVLAGFKPAEWQRALG